MTLSMREGKDGPFCIIVKTLQNPLKKLSLLDRDDILTTLGHNLDNRKFGTYHYTYVIQNTQPVHIFLVLYFYARPIQL